MQKLRIAKIRAVWKPNFQWIIWEFLSFFYLKVLNQNKRPGTHNFYLAKFPYAISPLTCQTQKKIKRKSKNIIRSLAEVTNKENLPVWQHR